jgi:hypothetical protein
VLQRTALEAKEKSLAARLAEAEAKGKARSADLDESRQALKVRRYNNF